MPGVLPGTIGAPYPVGPGVATWEWAKRTGFEGNGNVPSNGWTDLLN